MIERFSISPRRSGEVWDNWENKVKNGKLLIFRLSHPASPGSGGEQFTNKAGRLDFDDSNLTKDRDNFNEVWGEFVKPCETRTIKIIYRVEGIEKSGTKIYVGVIGCDYGDIISSHQKGNLENKIKSGKLLIYQSERVRKRGAGSPDSFVELPGLTRSLSFNFAKNNLQKDLSSSNEIWGEFVKPGKTEFI